MDQLLVEGARALAAQGILGLACAGLVYYIMMQRAEIKEIREDFDIKLAAKDKLIFELYERQVNQANASLRGLEIVKEPLESIARRVRGSTHAGG